MSKTVCVIDDDDLVRAKIALELKGAGYTALEASDALQGRRLLSENVVDSVVVDILMPDKDGVELISEIRRDWPAVRIVAMSGGGRVGPKTYLDIAHHMGAHACLAKPFSADELKLALD